MITTFEHMITRSSALRLTALALAVLWGGILHGMAQEQTRWLEVNVENAGELAGALEGRYDGIDSLVVRGQLNASDFHALWESSFYGGVTVMNLENTVIDGDSIPTSSFYHQDVQGPNPNENCFLKELPLRKILLPYGLKVIGRQAFINTQLEEIIIPESVSDIGEGTFDCLSHLKSVVLPKGLTALPDWCFSMCSKLKSIQLPKSLKSIGVSCFYFSGLEELELPESLEEIGLSAFFSTYVKEIIVPESCTKIGKSAFGRNTNLIRIVLPQCMGTIPSEVLYDCENLEEVVMPQKSIAIEESAFHLCVSLQNLTIPQGVRRIGNLALADCKIEKLILPETIEEIGASSCYMGNLKSIYCKAITPPRCIFQSIYDKNVENSPFDYYFRYQFKFVPYDIPVYVPVGSAELYRKAEGWNRFTNIVETADFPDESGIESTTMAGGDTMDVKVEIDGDCVRIATARPHPYSVTDMTGRIVARGTVHDESVVIPLHAGLYIVRVAGYTTKVAL